MGKTALLLDGLAAQYPGMLAALGAHPAVRETFVEAAGPLGRVTDHGLAGLDAAGSPADTAAAQLALLIAGVAGGRAAIAASGPPSAVVGCGVGGFAAGVLAGVLRLDEAIGLVHRQARMTARLFPAGGGMVRVSGLAPERLVRLADRIAAVAGPLWLARVDGPDASVLGGSARALRALHDHAPAVGAHRVERLEGAPPAHGPALRPVASELASALVRLPDRRPAFPCAGSVTGALLGSSSAVRADLALSVAATIRWDDAMAGLRTAGIEPLMPILPPTIRA
jgi:malonyl CoA-acyl carrier protein transacylase